MENGMEHICATCLAAGRRLTPLKIAESTFIRWFDVNITDPVCWECQATLIKFITFRSKVRAAQNKIQKYEENLKSLSQLSYAYKDSYDVLIEQEMKKEVEQCISEINYKDEVNAHVDEEYAQAVKIENNETCDISVEPAQPTHDFKVNIENDKIHKIKTTKKAVKTKNVEKTQKETNSFYKTKQLTIEEVEQMRRDDLKAGRYVRSFYKCETCILGYGNKEKWESHNYRLHREENGPQICKLCHQRFMQESHLRNHYKTHFKCYICCFCNFSHSRLRLIQHHYSSKHKNVYQCEKCKAEFPTHGKLTYHEQTTHRDLPICPVSDCRKTFKTDVTLKNHMLLHNGGTPRLECPVCHKLLKGVHNMRAHIKSHTAPPPPQPELSYCVTCDKQFTSRMRYQQHIKYSAPHREPDVLKYQCAHCRKRFMRKDNMEDHVLSNHVNKKDFVCELCNKTFNTIRLLTLHRARHEPQRARIRDKICELCGKGFMRKKTLLDHMNSHTGERPYGCQVCGDRFSYSAALFNHKRLKHENFKRTKKTKE